MSTFFRARVKETTTTTGTGSMQLLGAVPGYQTFLSPFGNGGRCYYMVVDGAAWEYGLGTINSSSQLARTFIIASTSGAGGISLAAGTKNVYCAIPPEACANNGFIDVADGVTTFTVRNGRVFRFNYTSIATITAFTEGIDGQDILLVNTGTPTITIQANASILTAGGANFSLTTNDTMRLLYYNAKWYELSRSTNT
jgi:hypothetical protein